MTNTILINVMYSGSYLKTNLGHEVINLIASDNGDNYVYVNPIGKIAKDKLKKYHIDCVLLGQLVNATTIKILAKATGVKMLQSTQKAIENSSATDWSIDDNDYKEHCKEMRSVRYGGESLVKIFDNGEKQLLATYKAKEVKEVKEELFIRIADGSTTTEDGVRYLTSSRHSTDKDFQFAKTNPYMYFPEQNDAGETMKDYKELLGIINDKKLWKDKEIGKYSALGYGKELLIEIMQKEDSELAFSNMIAYYLRTNVDFQKGFMAFLYKQNRDIPKPKGKVEILREHDNIDILLRYDDTAIVIENKIKASISEYKDGTNQLGKYMDMVKKDKDVKKGYFFLLTPNYAKFNLRALDYTDHRVSEEYKVIHYSDLLDILNKIPSTDDYRFNEFREAINLHSDPVDNGNFNSMMRRFQETINSIKQGEK